MVEKLDGVLAEFADIDHEESDDDTEAFGVLVFAHPSSRSTP